MDFTTQYVDSSILDDEEFPIGVLVYFHEELSNLRDYFSTLSKQPLMLNQFSHIMQQLKVIEHNLMQMDIAIDNKKSLIVDSFSFEDELSSCFN